MSQGSLSTLSDIRVNLAHERAQQLLVLFLFNYQVLKYILK